MGPQIEVTFDIDVDGILSVAAKEKETGVEQNVTIQGASTLSESEVQTMLEEAEKNAAADKITRENIDLKNQAELLCSEVEKELSLPNENVSDSAKQEINLLISEIKQNIQEDNIETLKVLLEDLKEKLNSMK